MPYPTRAKTTQEERTQAVIEKNKRTTNGLNNNKLIEYLGKDNVREFNLTITNKAFNQKYHLTDILKDRELCAKEVSSYFELCYNTQMIPTISSLCLYVGINKDTLYTNIQNTSCPVADLLKNAVDTCHSINEMGALNNNINAVLYMFLSKNYYGLQDTRNVELSTPQTTTDNVNTLKVIREQIALEEEQELLIE